MAKAERGLTACCEEEAWFEEDFEEIWQKAKECICEVAEKFPVGSITGIGITAQGDGLWLFDENMQPQERLLLLRWPCGGAVPGMECGRHGQEGI